MEAPLAPTLHQCANPKLVKKALAVGFSAVGIFRFYLNPLPKPSNFRLWETDTRFQSGKLPVGLKPISSGLQLLLQLLLPSSPLPVIGPQFPANSLSFRPCLMPLPVSPRHWGFHCNGSLCALLDIKPSLFGYSTLSYSAASRAERWNCEYHFLYICIYISLSLAISLP